MGGLNASAGQIVWCDLGPVVGRAQGGRRPCLVLQSDDFSDVIEQLVIVVPCTTRDRGWSNHILLTGETGLSEPTYAITEQQRTISVSRIKGRAGKVDTECLRTVAQWVGVWMHAAA